jgi:N-sulfoglucosamine sulfohydrolase
MIKSNRKEFLINLGIGLCCAAFPAHAADKPAATSTRPNMLWITSEDNDASWIGCYGNPHANTPHIDKLATEGFRYTHCFANAPVCAPSRSTWITGIHALSMGTHHMRSRYPIPHDKIRYYPDFLKDAGYYVSNQRKTDFNIGGREDGSAWDSSSLCWDTLKTRQPFFQIYNLHESHEKHARGPIENTMHKPENTRLRKYHPDLPDIRKNYAKYHDGIKRMDDKFGEILRALEESGLADDTIVIYASDHGGVMPMSKRYLIDSGIHCPLIIMIPEKFKHLWPADKPGSTVDRLVSYIDMPKTWLSMAGADIPDIMQGSIFLGPDAEPEPDYSFAFRGRTDERYDNARSIRTKQYVLIRNYMPYAPWMQRLGTMYSIPMAQIWDDHHKADKTTSITGMAFEPKRPEEFYDRIADPDNVNNLIDSPEHQAIIQTMRAELDKWQLRIHDAGMLPETEMVRRAEANKTTIYEMVRNPKLYNLKAYQETARLALQEDPVHLPALMTALKHEDLGIRYWAMVGILQIQDEITLDLDAIQAHLEDESHEVQALAAWVLYNAGRKAVAQSHFNAMLKADSYAALKVANIIDWIGDGAEPYRDSLAAVDFGYAPFGNRIKEHLGVVEEILPKTTDSDTE